MAKISIIVPVFNVEEYIDKCLRSLINQTFRDIEIIIVDDGSQDNSREIYEKYAQEDPRIKCIQKENAGVSEARNTGIQLATSECIMFVDSDDWAELNACEVLFNEYRRTGADLILADAIVITNGKPERNHIFKEAFTTSDPSFFKAYQKTCIGYSFNPIPMTKWNIPGLGSPWNKLFKRDIIQKYGLRFDPYVKGIYDDNLFTLHYLMHIKSMSYVKEPVYDFRIVTGSLTQSYKENTLDINRCIFERINDFINETNDRDYFTEAFYVYIIRRFSKSLNVYFFAENNPKLRKEKFAELKEVINSEPYSSAIKNVEIGRLLNNHKVVAILAKLKSPKLLRLALRLKRG